MRPFITQLLFSKQKWQLAAGIVCIYLPVRIFVSNNEFTVDIILNKTPLWAAEFLINLVFFRLWIAVIEAVQFSSNWLRSSFNFPRRFFIYAVGLLLAILFNLVFMFLYLQMATLLHEKLNITIKRSEQERSPYNREQKRKANTALTVLAMLATVYMVSVKKSNEDLQQIRLRAERLEKENLQSQFIALKNQLSPHFLFNSLSILTSLIEKNPQKSVLYVNRLSKSYRYILDNVNLESVLLRTELDFIDSYVFLLKSRFEHKLIVQIDIPPAIELHSRIAPLTLQMLIENAVKHNRMSQECPLSVTISVQGSYLVVSNPVNKRKGMAQSAEIGLPNIIRRYSLLTVEPVLICEADALFTVQIPLLT